jgi:hypothetical protein
LTIACAIFRILEERQEATIEDQQEGQGPYYGTLIKGGFAITAASIWIFHG